MIDAIVVVLLLAWIAFVATRPDGWKSLAYSGILIFSVFFAYKSAEYLEPYVKSFELRIILSLFVGIAAFMLGKAARWFFGHLTGERSER